VRHTNVSGPVSCTCLLPHPATTAGQFYRSQKTLLFRQQLIIKLSTACALMNVYNHRSELNYMASELHKLTGFGRHSTITWKPSTANVVSADVETTQLERRILRKNVQRKSNVPKFCTYNSLPQNTTINPFNIIIVTTIIFLFLMPLVVKIHRAKTRSWKQKLEWLEVWFIISKDKALLN